jgi:phenylalanine-4-hydroxylase
MAVEPVVYGASERPPRGDYCPRGRRLHLRAELRGLHAADHDTYRRLYERQSAAAGPGQRGVHRRPALAGRARPHSALRGINERLYRATRWELVAVPGLIPEVPFFTLLANRKFPVTDWIRTPEEFDYIVEPDIFHDLFGHVPLLFNPVFADYVQRYGQGGLKAQGWALAKCSRGCTGTPSSSA